MEHVKLLQIKLRELNKRGDDKLVGLIELSNEVLMTLTFINFCIDCEKKFFENNKSDDLTGALKRSLNSLKINLEEKMIDRLSGKMSRLSNQLSKTLCDGCQRKKYGDKEMARLLNRYDADSKTIKWIPFNELENIEYLAQGGFSKVYKATWINYYEPFFQKFGEKTVVLKKLNHSTNYIYGIIKEVKCLKCL